MINVAFFGTPSIGASALHSLINNEKINVVVVITTEDKPIGRSHSNLQPSPVANLANEHDIPTIKTNSINNDIEKLKKFKFDYIVTCAFGQFLSNEVLELPIKKALNVHGSLLPEGRGGAPLHWAIIKGKNKTGISIMEMVSEMDAGNYYSQYEMKISHTDTVDDLFEKMSNLILDKTAEGVIEVDNGKESIPQDESLVTFWMNIKKTDSRINFNQYNLDVHNQIRGLTSKPGAWTKLNGKIVKIHSSKIHGKMITKGDYGTIILVDDNGLLVDTANGAILINELTIEGSKRQKITSKDKHLFENKKFE